MPFLYMNPNMYYGHPASLICTFPIWNIWPSPRAIILPVRPISIELSSNPSYEIYLFIEAYWSMMRDCVVRSEMLFVPVHYCSHYVTISDSFFYSTQYLDCRYIRMYQYICSSSLSVLCLCLTIHNERLSSFPRWWNRLGIDWALYLSCRILWEWAKQAYF